MRLKKPSISRNLHGLLLGVGALLIHQSHALETDSLLQNFQSPPIETRLTVWWRFMDDYVSREGIQANVPITTRGNIWHLHAIAGTKGRISVRPGNAIASVKSARLLRTGEPIKFQWADGTLAIDFPEPQRNTPHDVIAVTVN